MSPGSTDNQDRQCGALPYRWRDGVLEVLLVTRRAHAEWIIPKGGAEPGYTEAQSAEVEAREEAGVVGRANETCVGTFRYRKAGQVRTVAVYDLGVVRELDRWPEQFERHRRWVTPAEAAGLVASDELAAILRDLPKRLATTRPDAPPAGG